MEKDIELLINTESQYGNDKKMQVCFVNTDQLPKSVRHLSYFTSREGVGAAEYIVLSEVIECTYPHPDAPDMANVVCISYRAVEKVRVGDNRAAPILLLEAAEKNAKLMIQKSSTI